MSGDSIHALQGVTSRVRAVGAQSARLQALRDRLTVELEQKREEVLQLTSLLERLAKVSELLRHLMDVLVGKQVQAIEGIVTEGLRSIFHDQVLSFEAEVGQKRNQTHIAFFIREGLKEDALSHRGNPLDAFGGGPSSVASLTLRILAVLRLKLWPFLALDEALGAVSDEYVDATGLFLKRLSDTMGFDTLLVTHKVAFAEHADVAYRCSQEPGSEEGSRRLTVKA